MTTRTLPFLALAAALTPACSKREEKRVVLYSSVDAAVLKPILDAHTARTGVRIDTGPSLANTAATVGQTAWLASSRAASGDGSSAASPGPTAPAATSGSRTTSTPSGASSHPSRTGTVHGIVASVSCSSKRIGDLRRR